MLFIEAFFLSVGKRLATMNSVGVISDNDAVIDTDLYSRQIGALGFETMGKLIKMKVLICGLNGAGVETGMAEIVLVRSPCVILCSCCLTAKNVILAGPNTVTLYDNTNATIQDLASNFYLTEDDVTNGISRAEGSSKRLAELNDYVNITVIKGELTPDVLRGFNVVVASDMKISRMIWLNQFCRSQDPPIGFIGMDGFGLCGVIFVDFGNEFTVFDNDGETPKSLIIEGITQVGFWEQLSQHRFLYLQ